MHEITQEEHSAMIFALFFHGKLIVFVVGGEQPLIHMINFLYTTN